jgi:[acyl-carrier-protein] S-malonyltransferase
MKFALCFPGQGSQSVGMMSGFADIPVVRQTFDEASEVLGQDFWALQSEGPQEALAKTVITQPLMLTAGVAVYRAWLQQTDQKPTVLAGHSLGEYTALVAAGALEFKDALTLTRFRGEAMQTAVREGEGGMAAILGLEDDQVEAACRDAAQGEVLQAANFNAPGQVVMAGSKTAVERGIEAAKARGAKRAILLPMSVPSHCDLMRSAADKLKEELKQVSLRTPEIPVLHNVDVQTHSTPEDIRTALVKQLYSPVRWVSIVRAIADQGVFVLGEAGPGKVLAPLAKRCDERVVGFAMNDFNSFEALLTALKGETA